MSEELLSVPEAAALLGVADQTLRNWVESGLVRHIRFPSGQVKFREADIEAILEPIEPTG